jgi:hypothetical protein
VLGGGTKSACSVGAYNVHVDVRVSHFLCVLVG